MVGASYIKKRHCQQLGNALWWPVGGVGLQHKPSLYLGKDRLVVGFQESGFNRPTPWINKQVWGESRSRQLYGEIQAVLDGVLSFACSYPSSGKSSYHLSSVHLAEYGSH